MVLTRPIHTFACAHMDYMELCGCGCVFVAVAAYFVIGEVFFGVLYNLLGVLGRETGVVLGAMLTFFGVANRLGDGDDFVAAAVLDLLARTECMKT